jgi:hypothetical protein
VKNEDTNRSAVAPDEDAVRFKGARMSGLAGVGAAVDASDEESSGGRIVPKRCSVAWPAKNRCSACAAAAAKLLHAVAARKPEEHTRLQMVAVSC